MSAKSWQENGIDEGRKLSRVQGPHGPASAGSGKGARGLLKRQQLLPGPDPCRRAGKHIQRHQIF